MSYTKTLTLALSAADDDGVSASQTPGGAGNLLINGALASGGVATLDTGGYARRVLFTFAADESGHTFVLYGTGWNGSTQQETIAGTTAGTVVSVRDYKTVTRISISAAATGAIKVGTNGVASTEPWIVDPYTAGANIGANIDITGTVNAGLQISTNYYGPAWDLNSVTPVWTDAANFTGKSADTTSTISESVTMVRLIQNSFSTGGTVTSSLIQPMASVS